jgi:hypothetical protein
MRVLLENPHRLLRRRGALVAYSNDQAVVRVLSGDLVTSVDLQRGNPLREALQVIDDLKPYDVTEPPRRLAAPRVPRALARQLEAAARARRAHGADDAAARALEIEPYELRAQLSLRAALRAFGPYRITTCSE